MTDEQIVKYDDKKHEYKLQGKKVPSVTELASDFAKLDKAWLAANPQYAARGTIVHAELAEYYSGEITADELKEPLSKEIIAHLEPHKDMRVENIVYNTGLGYCGTADLICVKGMRIYYVIDIKTGRTRSSLYEQCQLSLYLLALESMGYEIDDAILLILSPDGLTTYTPLSWEQMIDLDRGDLKVDDNIAQTIANLEQEMASLQPDVDRFNELNSQLKEILMGLFTDKEAQTYITDLYKFIFVKPSVRKGVDTVALKADGIYDRYIKESPVAASVRIQQKGLKDGE